jgi:hypothetical protein
MVTMSAPSQPALPATPAAPAPPPIFASSPTGSKPGRKSPTPSFLNSAALPSQPAQGTGKTLVGA